MTNDPQWVMAIVVKQAKDAEQAFSRCKDGPAFKKMIAEYPVARWMYKHRDTVFDLKLKCWISTFLLWRRYEIEEVV